MDQQAHQQHPMHEEHRHGPDCGHDSAQHGDHADYIHGSHRHAEHGDHWDEHGDVSAVDPNRYGSSDSIGVSRTDDGAAGSSWSAGPEDRPADADRTGGS